MPKTNNTDAGVGDGGNIRSAAVATEAFAEWTVEDMAQAEPYPLPEVSEGDLRAFAEGLSRAGVFSMRGW